MDDLDALLGGSPPGDDGLLDRVRAQTGRVVARRALARRAAFAAALLLVGGVAGYLARPTPEPVREYVSVPVPVVLPPDVPESPSAERALTAEEYELQAEQALDPGETAKLYRLAGDRFERRTEFGQARRCYQLYLLAAGPPGRAVSADDSWLLISLKSSHQREADRDAKQNP